MVKGQERVSADNLLYNDRVVTKDEIKKLSVEIGNMAAVICGVIPYISASTLKHSEKGTPTTERRDLAFLFTDIRGFTTICEGLSPEDVVAMLNHYLDIQTTAIVANGGEVDGEPLGPISNVLLDAVVSVDELRRALAVVAPPEAEIEIAPGTMESQIPEGVFLQLPGRCIDIVVGADGDCFQTISLVAASLENGHLRVAAGRGEC